MERNIKEAVHMEPGKAKAQRSLSRTGREMARSILLFQGEIPG